MLLLQVCPQLCLSNSSVLHSAHRIALLRTRLPVDDNLSLGSAIDDQLSLAAVPPAVEGST